MRSAVLGAGLLLTVVLVSTTTPAAAQVHGRLISRPPVPSPARPPVPSPSRPPVPSTIRRTGAPVTPLRPFAIWWNWGFVSLPAIVTLEQQPFGANAPAGGVQLDIQPWSAEVYVDGASVGRVEQFRGYYEHLSLPAGPHTIAVVAPGRDPLIFAIMVVPGRVVTQRATLPIAGPYTP